MSDTSANQDTAPDLSGPAQLREALDRAKSQLAEKDRTIASLTQAAKDSAFDQAGVPTDGWGKAFRKTYDGAITTDDIQAEVQAWNIPNPTATPQAEATPDAPAVDPAEAAALAQAQALRNVPPTPPNANLAAEEFDRMLASGEYNADDIDRVAAQHGLIELTD